MVCIAHATAAAVWAASTPHLQHWDLTPTARAPIRWAALLLHPARAGTLTPVAGPEPPTHLPPSQLLQRGQQLCAAALQAQQRQGAGRSAGLPAVRVQPVPSVLPLLPAAADSPMAKPAASSSTMLMEVPATGLVGQPVTARVLQLRALPLWVCCIRRGAAALGATQARHQLEGPAQRHTYNAIVAQHAAAAAVQQV